MWVYVTYDPLYEHVVCVHDKPNQYCKKCKPIFDKREQENCLYQIEESRFKVRTDSDQKKIESKIDAEVRYILSAHIKSEYSEELVADMTRLIRKAYTKKQ